MTAGADGTVRVFEARGGARVSVFAGHSGPVYSAAFSPDGTSIVTASDDRTARIYRCEACGSLEEVLARARAQLARG